MLIQPKILRNICLTAHPLGCESQVREQIDYVRDKEPLIGTKRSLIVGSSNGYGLAARILAAYGCGANTVGVAYERPGTQTKPASAGWYNDLAFRRAADRDRLGAWSINGDAFSREVKDQAVDLVKQQLGGVDLVVYSIASPRRMERLTALADQVENITPKQVDLSQPGDTEKFCDYLSNLPDPVSVLVNNAGYSVRGTLEDVPIEAARRLFEVNLFITFLFTD